MLFVSVPLLFVRVLLLFLRVLLWFEHVAGCDQVQSSRGQALDLSALLLAAH